MSELGCKLAGKTYVTAARGVLAEAAWRLTNVAGTAAAECGIGLYSLCERAASHCIHCRTIRAARSDGHLQKK